ncbi:hypothetical protein KC354_g154 [Hortaea werneckii]|nr:hypothetical protein KC354_g154 [Hortaea werneckii]
MTADLGAQGTVLKNIYAQLELRFNLLREITPKYTSYQFRSKVRSPFDGTPASKAIKGAAKREREWTHIDVEKAAAGTIPRNEIINKLRQWQDSGKIELQHSGVVNVYRLMRALPTTKEEKDQIINDVYADLESREGQDLDRIDDVVSLLTGTKCFARALAEHFGDSLPEGKAECGECTWCETHVPRRMDKPAPRTFNVGRFDQILSIVPDRDDPRYLARVAFGIRSPRVTAARLGRHQVFGSMEDHDFGLTESPADVPSSAIKQEDDRAERKPRVKREPIVKTEDNETKPRVKQEPTVKTEEAGVKSEPVNDVLVEEITRRDDMKYPCCRYFYLDTGTCSAKLECDNEGYFATRLIRAQWNSIGLFACDRIGKCQAEESGRLRIAACRNGRTYAFRPAAFSVLQGHEFLDAHVLADVLEVGRHTLAVYSSLWKVCIVDG